MRAGVIISIVWVLLNCVLVAMPPHSIITDSAALFSLSLAVLFAADTIAERR